MTSRRGAVRRAPRLGADELIAAHFTRLGRFRAVNPLKPKKLPSFSKFLGVIGWAVLVEESMRRARKAHKAGGSDSVTAHPTPLRVQE